MSKWADLYTKHDDSVHTVPIDGSKIPQLNLVCERVFGHVPSIDCHCKPHVRFSKDGEYLVINHRDHERGSTTADGQDTLQ